MFNLWFFEEFNIICIGINYIQNYDDEFKNTANWIDHKHIY